MASSRACATLAAAANDSLPPAASVREQLERILADPTFQASPGRRELLRYIVEESLAGRAERLKGFTIAQAVFGRGDDFDPQSDPVVRVEARRLRRDLNGYYAGSGRNDPVLVAIPTGGYVPQFVWRDGPMETVATEAAPAEQRRHRLSLPASALVVVALAAALLGAYQLLSTASPAGGRLAPTELQRAPRLAVLPFQNLSGDPEQAHFALGLTDQIVTDLARFKALPVLSLNSSASYAAQATDPRQLREALGVDYLLTGSAQHEGGRVRLTTRLVDTASGEIVWSESYVEALSPARLFDIQADVSRQVAALIGGDYGVVAEMGRIEAQGVPPDSLAAYDCVLRYYAYQRAFNAQEHATVRACLERTVELDPGYADAWAVLANIYAQEHRFGYNPRPALYDSYDRSLAAAERAVAIDPTNPTAQLMLANALYDREDFAGFRAAGERALTLNPNDPETLVHVGMRLVYSGIGDPGRSLVERAVALNPAHPQWYTDSLIFHHYQEQDYEQALAFSERQRSPGIWRNLFRAMILGQLGRAEEAQPVIAAVLQLRPEVAERFWAMARVWKIPDPQIAHMADGLRKAGLEIVRPANDPRS
jgi:TolB-like protein